MDLQWFKIWFMDLQWSTDLNLVFNFYAKKFKNCQIENDKIKKTYTCVEEDEKAVLSEDLWKVEELDVDNSSSFLDEIIWTSSSV